MELCFFISSSAASRTSMVPSGAVSVMSFPPQLLSCYKDLRFNHQALDAIGEKKREYIDIKNTNLRL
ncbi:MAG: hypothetical protein OXD29_05085, partial [Roseovarius sp.]|nr:hypothetical protein [Roseovarius sp.]